MKKILSEIFIALFLVLPIVPTYAATDFTLALDGKYSDNTLSDTLLHTNYRDITIGANQTIKYFHNDVLLEGEPEGTGFSFVSTAGENVLQAKVFDSNDTAFENPIAVSNKIVKTFKKLELTKTYAKDSYDYLDSETGELNSYDSSQYFVFAPTENEYVNEDDALKITADRPRDIGMPANVDVMKSELARGGIFKLQFDVKTDLLSRLRLLYIDTKNGTLDRYIDGPFLDTSGTLSGLPNNAEAIRTNTFSANDWYTIKVVMDLNKTPATYDFYVNNEQIITGAVTSEDAGAPGYVYLASNRGGTMSSFAIDNVSLSAMAESYTISTYTHKDDAWTDGLEKFPISGASAKIVFSQKMNNITKNNINFTVDGCDTDFDFLYIDDENAAVITPLSAFSGREKCRLSIVDAKSFLGADIFGESFVDFTIAAPKRGLVSSTHEQLVPGRSITATVSVADESEGIILIGMYCDGRLVSAATKSIDPTENSSGVYEITFNVPEDYTADDYLYITYLITDDTFYTIDTIVGDERHIM